MLFLSLCRSEFLTDIIFLLSEELFFLSCKIFFIVKTESIEVDNINVISEHFPLVPEFARFLCTSKSPLALLRFHGPFWICLLIICKYCLETKVHMILKQTKKPVVPFFHISYREIYVSQVLSQFKSKASALTKPKNPPSQVIKSNLS